MNVDFPRLTPLAALLLCLGLHSAASALDVGELSTPFADPLLARPPELDHARPLPGDPAPVACAASPALPAQPLSLADVVDLALCRHPQIQAAWAGIRIQAAQVGEARAAYLPTLNAGLAQVESQARSGAAEQSRSSRTGYATLSWRLLDLGSRAANQRSAEALLAAATASRDALIQKTLASVTGLYFDAQSARASLQAREQGEQLARKVLETALRREKRGVGSLPETLQARTFVARAELEHARAAGVHSKALVALAVAMGGQGSEQGGLGEESGSGSAPQLTLAALGDDEPGGLEPLLREWLHSARQQHPAILAAQAQLEAARERLGATRAEGLPTLDLNAGQYFNGRPNQSPGARPERESTVSLNLNIPLFDGFSRTYKVRGAQGQTELREAELKEIRAQVLGDIASAHADAVAALRNLSSSRVLQDSAQRAAEAIARKYDNGIADIVEMLNAQATLADAAQERIRALSEWRSARLRLLANAGVMGRSAVAPSVRP